MVNPFLAMLGHRLYPGFGNAIYHDLLHLDLLFFIYFLFTISPDPLYKFVLLSANIFGLKSYIQILVNFLTLL